MNEFEIINNIFKPLATSKESFGLTDDIAKISLKKDEELVISKDLLTENIHFKKTDGGYKIAKKALLSNLSDLAASGAKPYGYMLGFSKNNSLDEAFFYDFKQGLEEIQNEYKIKLLGGDTIKSKTLTLSVTIFGIVKKNKYLLRKNARNGDSIYVSGFIGDSYLGLKNKKNTYFHDRHFFPTPRIKLGQELLKNNLSNCAIDISDGLLADLQHICNTSNLNAKIHLEQIPISSEAKKYLHNHKRTTKIDLISGGEDYELIVSVNKNKEKEVANLAQKLKINLVKIGEFYCNTQQNNRIDLLDQNNQLVKIKSHGYIH